MRKYTVFPLLAFALSLPLEYKLQDGRKKRILKDLLAREIPEELIGKQLIVLANLAPRKMKGVESQGMILSALDGQGNLRLLSVDEGAEDGAIVG